VDLFNNGVLNAIGIIAFIVGLLLSVMIHEAGHYLTAKRFGMKVTEFFLGFGKRLWSTQRGETEFGIKAIPAGGYCKIVGMSPHEVLAEEDKERAFIKASIAQRLIVLGAGSFLHFVLGFILIFSLFTAVGTNQPLNTIKEVVPCILASGESECGANSPRSPASLSGIRAGDEILSIRATGGPAVSEKMKWQDIVEVIRSLPGKSALVVIERDGQRFESEILIASRSVEGQEIGVIGVINDYGDIRMGPIEATINSGKFMGEVVEGSFRALIKLPSYIPALIAQTFGGEERDPEGLVGIVGVARTTGEATSSDRLEGLDKVGFFLIILAGLNIFVGVFNLLPILPLDGGHMAVAIADGFKRWRAKRRGDPTPTPIDVEKLTPITMFVVVILISLTVLLLIADIVNPVRLGF